MHLQTIVALTDFSAAAEQGLERAALLAASHNARLRILYGTDCPDPKIVDPQARLEQRARQLARRHSIVVKAVARTGDEVSDALVESKNADLLVLDRRVQFSWRDVLRGAPLTRILRGSMCPVLVVQSEPQGAYERLLVEVDFSEASTALMHYAGALDNDAAMELYHALDLREEAQLRSAEASQQAIESYRVESLHSARQRMLSLSDTSDARRNRVDSMVGVGDPARQLAVQQERTGADLVAVGHKRRSALVELLMGSVAQRLVGGIACDVLVFPHDYALPERPAGLRAHNRVSAG
jgi:nucleotide-binding universal stress UspA family protein